MHSLLPYYHAVYTVFTYFTSFTDYEDGIFRVFSYLHAQGSKIGGKMDQFGVKSLKKFNSAKFMEFVFSKSGLEGGYQSQNKPPHQESPPQC